MDVSASFVDELTVLAPRSDPAKRLSDRYGFWGRFSAGDQGFLSDVSG